MAVSSPLSSVPVFTEVALPRIRYDQDKKPLGDPDVRSMNTEERRKLQELDAATAP
jgi:hypothetical protein